MRFPYERYSYSEKQLRDAVARSVNLREVLRCLGIIPAGGNYETTKRRISKLGIDTSHFTGLPSHPVYKEPRPIEEYLIDGKTVSTDRLRRRLIREGVFERKCHSCNLTDWLSRPIPLELDHVDGRRENNKLDNLRLLCPNCHALTGTYRGRNQEKHKVALIKACSGPVAQLVGGNPLKMGTGRVRIPPGPPKLCADCQKPISRSAIRCRSCTKIGVNASIEWPEVSVLLENLKIKSYCQLAKELGVSDNAIRKHLLHQGVVPPRARTMPKSISQ